MFHWTLLLQNIACSLKKDYKFLDDENLCFDRDETDLPFKTVQIADQMALLDKGFAVP